MTMWTFFLSKQMTGRWPPCSKPILGHDQTSFGGPEKKSLDGSSDRVLCIENPYVSVSSRWARVITWLKANKGIRKEWQCAFVCLFVTLFGTLMGVALAQFCGHLWNSRSRTIKLVRVQWWQCGISLSLSLLATCYKIPAAYNWCD